MYGTETPPAADGIKIDTDTNIKESPPVELDNFIDNESPARSWSSDAEVNYISCSVCCM